jgi:hypothetical protein
MELQGHPIGLLDHFGQKWPNSLVYEFSKYVYIPQSVNDDREYHLVEGAGAQPKVMRLMKELNPKQELAIHSKVSVNGEEKHIPMLDLLSEFQPGMIASISSLMKSMGIKEFEVYLSGRSAHVYGLTLISSSGLMRFFASALLLNLPDQNPIVDSRWIGHRMLAGYGSLRWSFNTKQYLGYPKLLDRFTS